MTAKQKDPRLPRLQWTSGLLCLLAWPVRSLPSFRAIDVLNEPKKIEVEVGDTFQSSDVHEVYFDRQRLNHFDAADSTVWSQRYFYSNRFVRSFAAKHYVYFCVGGEGPPLDKSVLVDSVHCTGDMLYTAGQLYQDDPDLSIHLYALEHRYYGTSQPFAKKDHPYSNENLVYLSSQQALYDVVTFLNAIVLPLVPVDNPTIITFGSSYPGYLSALLRVKFPHLIDAAISNSAPVQATLNMVSYNNQVGRDLQNHNLGGSLSCYNLFVEGHKQLSVLVQTQPELIADRFRLCDAASLQNDPRNIQLFLGDGVYDLGTQSNDPACTSHLCNLDHICTSALEHHQQNATKEWETLAWLARQQQHGAGDFCLELDWNATLNRLSDSQGWWRAWLWQTCTEVGYYQTCLSGTECPFGRDWHPLSQDLEICEVAFGVTHVAENVQATNVAYGGYAMTATRVLSVTGTEDPWSTLAFRPEHPPPHGQPYHSVPDASHHYWTHRIQETDSDAIHKARAVILEQIKQWQGEIQVAKESILLEQRLS